MNEEDFKAEAKSLVKKHSPHVSDEDIDLHSDSAYYWGAENFAQASDWLKKTVEILCDPSRFSNAELFTNFWGVIDDGELITFLREKAIGSLSVLGYAEADIPKVIEKIEDEEMKRYFQLLWEAKNLFDPIQKQFSDDEKFLLRFLRHRHCHVTLNKFSVKIEGKGQDAKFKTANWERLVSLSKVTNVKSFRETLLAKLGSNLSGLDKVARLLMPSGSNRLFQE